MLECQHIPHLLEFTITTQYLGKEAKGKNFLVIISVSSGHLLCAPRGSLTH